MFACAYQADFIGQSWNVWWNYRINNINQYRVFVFLLISAIEHAHTSTPSPFIPTNPPTHQPPSLTLCYFQAQISGEFRAVYIETMSHGIVWSKMTSLLIQWTIYPKTQILIINVVIVVVVVVVQAAIIDFCCDCEVSCYIPVDYCWK